jgi:hypothetical protein
MDVVDLSRRENAEITLDFNNRNTLVLKSQPAYRLIHNKMFQEEYYLNSEVGKGLLLSRGEAANLGTEPLSVVEPGWHDSNRS